MAGVSNLSFDQAMKTWTMNTWTAPYVMSVRYQVGPSEPAHDDTSGAYEDILELNTVEPEYGDLDRADIATVRAAGDETLAQLLEQELALAIKIDAHCRAVQAGMTAATVDEVVNFEPGMMKVEVLSFPKLVNWRAKLEASASERTCSTCSKTCDVGVACWWCGNA